MCAGDEGDGSEARFDCPAGMAGTDEKSTTVSLIKQLLGQTGAPAGSAARFDRLKGIVVDSDDNILWEIVTITASGR